MDYNLVFGFLIGFLCSGSYPLIIYFTCIYLSLILAVRICMVYFFQLLKINGPLYNSPEILILYKFISEENIIFTYNFWVNRIIIERNLSAKLSTDSDKIESLLKTFFNYILGWDIFYHIYPLSIKFE